MSVVAHLSFVICHLSFVIQPDILLCELLLPGEDGYWLIRQIRGLETKRGYHVAAIAVTVAATEQERQLALAAGFDSHIAKPLKVDDL
ncbi:MAG: response regulator [Coleofasciculus chthonoplastes F3-SA18-01]